MVDYADVMSIKSQKNPFRTPAPIHGYSEDMDSGLIPYQEDDNEHNLRLNL